MDISVKLRIKKDRLLYLLDAPANCRDIYGDALVKNRLPAKEQVSQLVFFAKNKEALVTKIPLLAPQLADDIILWVAYPKKAGKIGSDLGKYEDWDILGKCGLAGVSSIALDDDWAAVRFKKDIGLVKKREAGPRKIEGVDYNARTVKVPADAMAAMKKHKGVEGFFNQMAFTHKKEYVEAIVEAKKPETRQRRIEKTIEMLKQVMEKKKFKSK